jgi:ABC-2 type transport system ATP-binding protein
MSLIEAHELTKRFGTRTAVHELSFTVSPGAVTGFLGPNGAGKTTTLRMLLGLVEPTAGSATIRGHRYRDLPDPLHEVGAVLEASAAHPGRTARNHLRLQAMAARVSPTRADEMLELTGLAPAADRRAGQLSLGMRQRLALAAALLPEPDLLILDEPTNGLDPEGVRWLRDLLHGIAAQGRTVLVSSHILAEVAQTVGTVLILDHGRLITQAPLDQLIARQGPLVRLRTPEAGALQAVLTADGARVLRAGPDSIEVTGTSPERVAALAAEHSIPILDTTTQPARLEDVFLHLTTSTSGSRQELA